MRASGRRAGPARPAFALVCGATAWLVPALLLAAAGSPIAPSRPTVTARAEPSEATVGDRVRVELDVALPAGSPAMQPRTPAGFHHWGTAEVLAVGEAQRLPGDPGAPRYRLHLVLTAFAPGEVELPPVPIVLTPAQPPEGEAPAPEETVLTPAGLGFTVNSVLPAEGSPTPQPPAPPRPLPLGAAFWWTAGALALATAAAATALLLRGRVAVAAEASAALSLPPLAGLLHDLAALQDEASAERLHTRLSAAVRRFLAGLLGFAASERTTAEIDRELRRGPLACETRRGLVDLLRRCDEVKFARQPATTEEARTRVARAQELAFAAERQLRPPPAAAEATAGSSP